MDALDANTGVNPYILRQTLRTDEQNKTKKNERTEKTAKKGFLSFFNLDFTSGVHDAPPVGTTETLLDLVHSSGDALKKNPLPDEIKNYKEAVRNFIRHVIDNGLELRQDTGVYARGKKKMYQHITIIDSKLESLASAIMAGQLTNIKLVERIDEIRGLIINLLQ